MPAVVEAPISKKLRANPKRWGPLAPWPPLISIAGSGPPTDALDQWGPDSHDLNCPLKLVVFSLLTMLNFHYLKTLFVQVYIFKFIEIYSVVNNNLYKCCL